MSRRSTRPYRIRLGPLAIADWVLMVAVCLVPIGFMVARSFGRVNAITLDVEMSGTIDAYRTLFSPTYRPVMLRSLALAGATVLLCVVVGLPTALAMSRLGPRARTWAVAAVMMPSFVSFSVRIFAWQGVLATGGPIESITGLQLLYRPPAVLIGMITAYVPLFILPTYSALSRVPREALDAASDLYATPRRQLTAVTLPLALPGIVTGTVLVAVLSIGEFIVPAVLGGGKVLLLGNILAERGAGRDQPLGGAITVMMLAVFLLAAVIVALVRRRSPHLDAGAGFVSASPDVRRAGRTSWRIGPEGRRRLDRERVRRVPSVLILGLFVVLLYAPLMFVIIASLNRNPDSTSWQGFTFGWYQAAFDDKTLRSAVWVSVQIAVGATVLAVLTGTAAAIAARHSRVLQRINLALATARVGTPEIILATGLGALLPTIGIGFGRIPMVVAHTAYLSAYVMLIVGARAAGSAAVMEESALDLGATPWRVIRKVILPDLLPAIASAALLALAFSFDDVALSLALRGADDTTVPLYIFSAVQRRVTPSIHAIGAMVILIGVTVFAAASLINRAIAARSATGEVLADDLVWDGSAQARP